VQRLSWCETRREGWDGRSIVTCAWGTAYRMLFTQATLQAGQRVLVPGAGGGVASTAIKLAVAAGATVYATSRSPEKLELAKSWQDKKDLNLFAGPGIAVREVVMKPGHGRIDYLLYVDKAVGGLARIRSNGAADM
jgi:NADPH:quinone reductase-like Zn-dependent oxidoreductase